MSYAGGDLTLSLALLPNGCKFDSDPGKLLPHPAKLSLPLRSFTDTVGLSCGPRTLIWALPIPTPLVPTEFSISSFCTVVDVMNFSKLQVLRLDGNEIKRSAMPADAPLCLRLASLIEI